MGSLTELIAQYLITQYCTSTPSFLLHLLPWLFMPYPPCLLYCHSQLTKLTLPQAPSMQQSLHLHHCPSSCCWPLSCCLTFPGRHSWSPWFIIPSLAVLTRAYGVPLQREAVTPNFGWKGDIEQRPWAWHILLLPCAVASLYGLLVWCCFPSCNQAQHSHFSETPLDTSLFKLIE